MLKSAIRLGALLGCFCGASVCLADDRAAWSISSGIGPRWYHPDALDSLAEEFFLGRDIRAGVSDIKVGGNTAIAVHWHSSYPLRHSTSLVYGASFEVGHATYSLPNGAGVFMDPMDLTTTYAALSPTVGLDQEIYRFPAFAVSAQLGLGVEALIAKNSLTSPLPNANSVTKFQSQFAYSELTIGNGLTQSGYNLTARMRQNFGGDPELTVSLAFQF